jgi:hypothetical protein
MEDHVMRISCLILVCLGVLGTMACAAPDDGPKLAPPVQIQAAGKPISVDIGHAAPFLADIDGSGKPVLLVGQFGQGKLRIYANKGTAQQPRFDEFSWFQAGGDDGKIPSG